MLQGDLLELRLPAGFLESDVAFDETNQRSLAVWTENGSGGLHAVYGQLRSTSGASVGGLIPIAFTALSTSDPELADINATNRFLIVHRDGSPLHGRSIDAGSGLVASAAVIADLSPSRVAHDVGGEVSPPYELGLGACSGPPSSRSTTPGRPWAVPRGSGRDALFAWTWFKGAGHRGLRAAPNPIGARGQPAPKAYSWPSVRSQMRPSSSAGVA